MMTTRRQWQYVAVKHLHLCFRTAVSMDDIFGMLYSDLEPKKKLLTAVTSNMIDSLDKLASSGIDLNETLHHHNGNHAIHIAASNGHKGCVQKLLDYGAAPDATNRFGFTALSLALRNGHASCAQALLSHGSPLTDPDIIWNSQNMDETPTWLSYNAECLKVLINATANFSQYDNAHEGHRVNAFMKDPEIIRLYLLCGNTLSDSKYEQVLSNVDEKTHKWMKDFGKCKSLQHFARSAIRQNLHPNVYYASRNLPIPVRIQEYLLISDVSSPDV